MLPFLKNKQQAGIAGVIIKNRKPDEKPQDAEKTEENSILESHAEDMIAALRRQDAKALAAAFRAAFECLELEPHAEGAHTYEAQNIKAATEEAE